MKLIITESQKEKVLRNLIKNNGVKFASNMVGGIENLFDVLNIKSPMEFLNMYNDLDVVQSEEKKDWTLFRYEKYKNLMIYDRENYVVYINYYEIWSFLKDGFGLNYTETQELTKTWLDEVYDLRGITTNITSFERRFQAG